MAAIVRDRPAGRAATVDRLGSVLTVVLTRHGLTDRSDPEQHLGQHIDVSLNAAGRRQAESLAKRLAAVPFDRVISSPLFRAQETAQIVGRGARVETDPRLKEMDYGSWEGLSYEQIEFFTQGEYFFDAGTRSGNFFYSWSELSYAPVTWFRAGIVIDRTKALGSNFEVRRGPLVGFKYKKIDFTTYWLSPGSLDSTFIFTVALNF